MSRTVSIAFAVAALAFTGAPALAQTSSPMAKDDHMASAPMTSAHADMPMAAARPCKPTGGGKMAKGKAVAGCKAAANPAPKMKTDGAMSTGAMSTDAMAAKH